MTGKPKRHSAANRNRAAMRGLALAATAFAALCLLAPSAFASKQVVSYFGVHDGSSETQMGGEFDGPGDVAVNGTGAGGVPVGTTYVTDPRNNRIERFDAEGNFVSAWGANVLTPAVSEVQTLTIEATAGTFTLSFDGATTGSLAYDAPPYGAGGVQPALEALPTVGSNPGGSNIRVIASANTFTFTFKGRLSSTDVPQVTVDTSNLTGTASTATTTQGSGKYEICTVAAECIRGNGGNGGTVSSTGGAPSGGTPNVSDNEKNGAFTTPQGIAVDEDTGNVYVADREANRINEYTASGTFIRTFGWGVDASVPGGGYEVCPASDHCQGGTAGSGAGQIGSTTADRTLGIAVSQPDGNASTGTLYLADSANQRVNTYNLDGSSPGSLGSAATFGATQPRQLAVDPADILYASNSGGEGELERYDTGGSAFLEPITATNSTPAGPLLAGSPATATAGLEVDSAGKLYVLRDPSSGDTVVQQFDSPGTPTPPAADDDEHGGEAGFTAVNGLGLDDSTGRLLVSSSSTVSGVSGSHVYVLDDSGAPAATLDPVTEVSAHSANLTGTVDPGGALTGYHLEYVDDATFQADVTNLGAGHGFDHAARFPAPDARLNGSVAVSISRWLPAHLLAGVTYHVQLVAKQVFTSQQSIGGPRTFTTATTPPSFETDATGIESESATLRGAINPENQAVTDYHFNWGTDASYGHTTASGSLSSGNDPVAVSAQLGGLEPGTTYHFQLVATNATGTNAEADQTFTTPAGPPQFPPRAYELASYYPTGSVPVLGVVGYDSASEDGNSIAMGLAQPPPGTSEPPLQGQQNGFGSGEAGLGKQQYLSVRGADGWQLRDIGIMGQGWSADLERLLTVTGLQPDPRRSPDDPGGQDVYLRQPDSTLTWLSRDPRIPAGIPQTGSEEANAHYAPGSSAMSADGRTAVFSSRRQLLDADTTDPENLGQDAGALYKWEDGTLDFIGIRPDGSVPRVGSSLGAPRYARYAVSRNGERVVWAAQRSDGGQALYVQRDGAPTVEITKETGVPPLPSGQPYDTVYRGAAADDSRVFFTSASRLTPDSGAGAKNGAAADLYLYDLATDKLRDLTPRLDGIEDPGADPATVARGRVLGVAANSEDGKTVYFVAEAAYSTAPNPEGDLPAEGEPNLYMARLGENVEGPIELRFVATLDAAADYGVWAEAWDGESRTGGNDDVKSGKTALASPDGRTLGFGAARNLIAGRATGGATQLYAYDAGTRTLGCASCPGDGSLPAGEVNRFELGGGQHYAEWQGPMAVRRWVASDGTVFFHTATPLLGADENLVSDVYQYRDGALQLITTGKGTGQARFFNAAVDGSTVFFNTSDALVAKDKEPGVPKIYAARVGGGFPYNPPEPPCEVSAGACEGKGTSAPDVAGAGTAAFSGPGNQASAGNERCTRLARTVRRLSRRAKRLRSAARKSRNPRRVRRLRLEARRYAHAARKRSIRARRCRRAARGVNANGRSSR